MDDKIDLIKTALGEHRLKFDESLYYHSYTKCKTTARFFYIATSNVELTHALDTVYQLDIPYFVIGGGTKAVFSGDRFEGLVIKNRTSGIKTVGVKGKVGRDGIGVEEAIIEVDSGVTMQKLNDYLKNAKLMPIKGNSHSHSTIGGAVFLDNYLKDLVSKIVVWEVGVKDQIETQELKLRDQIVLSVVIKAKAL